jgi:phosphate transport system substrate-binding protein
MKRLAVLWLAASVLATSLSGCGGGKRLNLGGSTFINPMMEVWTYEYYQANGVEVNYASVGSGAGIKQMIDKILDFGCSDAPLNDEQLKQVKEKGGEVVHIPVAMGAVVPIYNLAGVTKPVRFSGEALADIFLGKITRWNDSRLQELQEAGVTLPDRKINVVHRSDGSGTTFIFAEYLSKVSPEWKTKVGKGTSLRWPTGIGAPGNPGVANEVKNSPGAIGYVDLIYALENDISYGSVRNRAGHCILGDLTSVTAAADGAKEQIPDDLRYSLTDAPGKDSYPISGTTWAIVYVNQPPEKAQLMVDFLRWVTGPGQEMCEAQHYARLPPDLVRRAREKIELIKSAN